MVGIIARLPSSFVSEFLTQASNNRWIPLILEFVFFGLIVIGTILVLQGIRKIPIQSAKGWLVEVQYLQPFGE